MSTVEAQFYRLIIKIKETEELSSGGIYLSEGQRRRENISSTEGIIVSIGPIAFDSIPNLKQRPKIGDHVIIAKHAGSQFKRQDGEYRIINDEDILAIEVFEEGETPTETKKV